MKVLQLHALDTLFFKDGKPFSMGEETWARGVFPPHPSVFYGLLRSIWLSNGNLTELSKGSAWNDVEDPSLRLSITGLLPTIGNDVHFPIPNDTYILKTDRTKAHLLDWIEKPEGLVSDYENALLLQTRQNLKTEDLNGKAFLSATEFQKYLNGLASEFEYRELKHYVLSEPKVGIGRSPMTRATETGQLYRVGMNRLHGSIFPDEDGNFHSEEFGFAVRFNGLTLPKNGTSRFGAEIKAVEYEMRDDWAIACPVKEGDEYFKIYLATPAVFEEGFYPETAFKNEGFALLTGAFGRVQHIGGFDMKALKPKPMLKAVPAGTVYYVKATKKITQQQINALCNGSIYSLKGTSSDWGKQGFGHCYLGKFTITK